MKTTNTEMMPLAAPLSIQMAVSGSLNYETRETIDRLAYAIQHQHAKCDAIGESGHKCNLAAGHPGEIHEEYDGHITRFRLAGESWRVR